MRVKKVKKIFPKILADHHRHHQQDSLAKQVSQHLHHRQTISHNHQTHLQTVQQGRFSKMRTIEYCIFSGRSQAPPPPPPRPEHGTNRKQKPFPPPPNQPPPPPTQVYKREIFLTLSRQRSTFYCTLPRIFRILAFRV